MAMQLNTSQSRNFVPDQRRESRYDIARQPRGRFQLFVGHRTVEVRSLLDASSQGLRLRVAQPVGKGVDVRVRYRCDEIDLILNGTTVWSDASDAPANPGDDDEGYALGISLVSPTVLQVFL